MRTNKTLTTSDIAWEASILRILGPEYCKKLERDIEEYTSQLKKAAQAAYSDMKEVCEERDKLVTLLQTIEGYFLRNQAKGRSAVTENLLLEEIDNLLQSL